MQIELAQQPNTLWIPSELVHNTDEGAFVWLLQDDQIARRQRIELGSQDNDWQEVTAGVTPEDWLIREELSVELDGQKVVRAAAAL